MNVLRIWVFFLMAFHLHKNYFWRICLHLQVILPFFVDVVLNSHCLFTQLGPVITRKIYRVRSCCCKLKRYHKLYASIRHIIPLVLVLVKLGLKTSTKASSNKKHGRYAVATTLLTNESFHQISNINVLCLLACLFV